MRLLFVQTLLSISRDALIPWQMGEVRGNSIVQTDHYITSGKLCVCVCVCVRAVRACSRLKRLLV